MNFTENDFAPASLVEISEKIRTTQSVEQLYWIHGYVAGLINGRNSQNGQLSVNGNILNDSKLQSTVIKQDTITILYGTQGGNSKKVANQLFESVQQKGLPVKIADMGDYDPKNLKNEKLLFIVVSTQGEGEPPLSAEGLVEHIFSKKAAKLESLQYSVFALGDKSYVNFCKTGIDFDKQLESLGAKRIVNRVDCDVQFQTEADRWIEAVLQEVAKISEIPAVEANAKSVSVSAPTLNLFTRDMPGQLLVTEVINLNARDSGKLTMHLELSAEGQPFSYEPGDALGIYFENPSQLADEILRVTNINESKKVSWNGEEITIRDFLIKKAELTNLSRQTIEQYIKWGNIPELSEIIADNTKLTNYIYGRDVLDLLLEFPLPLNAERLAGIIQVMKPRLYSIASSAEYVPGEVHITVAALRYEFNTRRKEGACSGYITSNIEPGSYLSAYISKNEVFRLPDESKDVIMIGPGTGVAPFRAFLQHREITEATGRNWLFFGDRHFTTDFIYQTEWQKLKKTNVLNRIDLAFSRDQQEKIYVQHKMVKQASDLFQWIESGAHIYVCGDKNRMAKDVHNTLIDIIKEQGGLSLEKATEYVKNLRKQKRYLEDVY